MTCSVSAQNDAPRNFVEEAASRYIKSETDLNYYQPSRSSDIGLAYLIQASYIQQKNKPIVGYKIGLSSKAAQRKFNYNHPVFGVLLQQDDQRTARIKYSSTKKLVEVELAFRMKVPIHHLDQLKQPIDNIVSEVAPVVEMPLINFENINAITAFDIIATNVGAGAFITGEFVDLMDVDVNNLEIELWLNGEHKMGGLSNTPLNNQFSAIVWVLRQALLQGYHLKKDQILLTGSILKPMVLLPGEYTAKFIGMENVSFRVE